MENNSNDNNSNDNNHNHHSNNNHNNTHRQGGTRLKVKDTRQAGLRDDRIIKGIGILAMIVVAGFLLTWAFPRNTAEKPEVSPPVQDNVRLQQLITQRVSQVPGVKETKVFVLSRVALIVIQVDPELPPYQVKRIKNDSASQAKGLSGVDEVLVTASPVLARELQEILEGEVPLERLEYIYERIRDQNM